MDSFCSSSWTLSTAAEFPTLMDGFGTGIEWGLGLMLVGVAQGVLTQNKATNIEHCIGEVKVLACDMASAYKEAVNNHDLGQMLYYVSDAYSQLDTTKADCVHDIEADLPALEQWAAVFAQPMSSLEKQITKNVMRHVFAFTEYFNTAKRTWDAHSYYWTGERVGEMLVMATAKKNILY